MSNTNDVNEDARMYDDMETALLEGKASSFKIHNVNGAMEEAL